MKCPFCGGVLPEAPPPSSPKATSKERIILILKDATAPLSPSEIGRRTGLKPGTVRWALRELLAAGVVLKDERGYSLPNRDTNEQSEACVGGQTEGGDSFSLGVKLSAELLAAARTFYERGEKI